jgi:hypothetical protein
MLQRDPSTTVDNQVQVYLENGTTIPLIYQSTQNGQTTWTGLYKLGGISTRTILKGSIEAVAYGISTDQTTHFATLPPGFSNTGLTQEFSYTLPTDSSSTSQGTSLNTFITGIQDKLSPFLSFLNPAINFIQNEVIKPFK